MQSDAIRSLTESVEAHAQLMEGGVEYRLGRDLQYLLGYAKWENFLNVVGNAKTACELSGRSVTDHFPDVREMVDLGSGSRPEIDAAVRRTLLERGIRPELLAPGEDVKKVGSLKNLCG